MQDAKKVLLRTFLNRRKSGYLKNIFCAQILNQKREWVSDVTNCYAD